MYDLDNIQLGALSADDRVRGMEAVFDLDFLVVEGHAREPQSNMPPRGVQLQLTNGNGPSIDDTQVVATLGYLQFKITPGVFRLQIREGRGRDIFKLESVGNEGWDSPTVDEAGDEITLTSFEGLTLYPRLTRQPGMDSEDVLASINTAVEEPPSLIANVVSRWGHCVYRIFPFCSQHLQYIIYFHAEKGVSLGSDRQCPSRHQYFYRCFWLIIRGMRSFLLVRQFLNEDLLFHSASFQS
jgi:hypothetical protein